MSVDLLRNQLYRNEDEATKRVNDAVLKSNIIRDHHARAAIAKLDDLTLKSALTSRLTLLPPYAVALLIDEAIRRWENLDPSIPKI